MSNPYPREEELLKEIFRMMHEDKKKEIVLLAHDKNVMRVNFRGKIYNIFAVEEPTK